MNIENKIIHLDGFRMYKGYKQGWLYHQVKDKKNYLDVLIQLQNEGKIGRGYNKEAYEKTLKVNNNTQFSNSYNSKKDITKNKKGFFHNLFNNFLRAS